MVQPPPPKKKKTVADPFLRFKSIAFLFEFAFLCGKMHVRIYLIEIKAERGLIAGRLLINGIRIVFVLAVSTCPAASLTEGLF